MSDSSDIDNAIVAALGADLPLLALMPNGVYFDVGPEGATQYVLVSLVVALDIPMFGGTAFEDCYYTIRAMERNDVPTRNAKAAAARIQTILPPMKATLVIPGYSLKLIRRTERIRRTEIDQVDNSIEWYHRGGQYQVMVAPTS